MSDEKSVIIFIVITLYVMYHFSLDALKIYFLLSLIAIGYVVPSVSFFEFILCKFSDLLELLNFSLSLNLETFSHYFFKCFFLSLFIHMVVFGTVPEVPEALFIFFILFLCSSDCMFYRSLC